jgi:hypothetical protein
MEYDGRMIDFPITEPLDDSICLIWLERYLHPTGLCGPHDGSSEWLRFRPSYHCPAYRCRGRDGYDPLPTGTAFAKTRQYPATLVRLPRAIATGRQR